MAMSMPMADSPRGRSGVPPIRPGEDPWTPGELAEVRAELVEARDRQSAEAARLRAGLADTHRAASDAAGEDGVDIGGFGREQEWAMLTGVRAALEQTTHALERLDRGTYGACEGCTEPIGKLRLLAFPRATLCVRCKQRQERR